MTTWLRGDSAPPTFGLKPGSCRVCQGSRLAAARLTHPRSAGVWVGSFGIQDLGHMQLLQALPVSPPHFVQQLMQSVT